MYKYLLILLFAFSNFGFSSSKYHAKTSVKCLGNCAKSLTIKDSVIVKDSIELIQTAEFENYIQTELRQVLISAKNDGTINPRSDDAGNWSGCGCNKGRLVGTFRDISACAYKAYFKKEPTVQDLRNMTYDDAKEVYHWFWSDLKVGELYDQDLANLIMHIKLHYGNIYIVQNALNKMGYNLKVDGQMGKNTLSVLIELSKTKPIETYKIVRKTLLEKYKGANPVYRKGFINFLNKHFPTK